MCQHKQNNHILILEILHGKMICQGRDEHGEINVSVDGKDGMARFPSQIWKGDMPMKRRSIITSANAEVGYCEQTQTVVLSVKEVKLHITCLISGAKADWPSVFNIRIPHVQLPSKSKNTFVMLWHTLLLSLLLYHSDTSPYQLVLSYFEHLLLLRTSNISVLPQSYKEQRPMTGSSSMHTCSSHMAGKLMERCSSCLFMYPPSFLLLRLIYRGCAICWISE